MKKTKKATKTEKSLSNQSKNNKANNKKLKLNSQEKLKNLKGNPTKKMKISAKKLKTTSKPIERISDRKNKQNQQSPLKQESPIISKKKKKVAEKNKKLNTESQIPAKEKKSKKIEKKPKIPVDPVIVKEETKILKKREKTTKTNKKLENVEKKINMEEHNEKSILLKNKRKIKLKIDPVDQIFDEEKKKASFVELKDMNLRIPAKYSNFEYVLALLELVWNKEYYRLNKFSDKSRNFWENAVKLPICNNIFRELTSETLRKYFRLLNVNSSVNLVKFTKIIESIKDCSDVKRLKLKPLLFWLIEHISGDKSENSIKSLSNQDSETSSKTFLNKKNKKFLKEETEKNLFNDITLLRDDKTYKKKIYKFVHETHTISDKEKFLCINEIIETFRQVFGEGMKETAILDVLISNSFNIESSFKCLNERKGKFLVHVFTPNEDYTILNLKDRPEYEKLVEIKGEKLIKERLNFLGN